MAWAAKPTGFFESLPGLIGLDWEVPDFSTLSRRRKALAVNIPYRRSPGPLHLLIDIEPASATGSSEPARGIKGEWNARRHGGTKRRLGRALWRRWSGHDRRSRVETRMHCVKLPGQRPMARDFDRQVAEFHVRVAVLNRFTALGIPVADVVG